MFARAYYPSAAGSVVVPSTAGSVVMPASGYGGSAYGYGGGYGYAAPMSAPVVMSSFGHHHHRPAPVIVPTTAHYGGYGYASPMPYYGGMTPTVVMSSRSSGRWRRSRHRSRFFDF